MLQIALLVIGVLVVLAALVSLADNLIQIEAKKSGIDTEKVNMSVFPSFGELFGAKIPSYTTKENFHSLKKGHDIKLEGSATGSPEAMNITRFAVKPGNFRGIAPIPKLFSEVGSEIKAGDPLFYDKGNPEIHYAAPVSGEIIEVKRGAKRAISDVIILADKNQQYKKFDIPNLETTSREELVDFLAKSGIWPSFIQRPFGIVADLNVVPRDIFISGFNTAPLAPSYDHMVVGREDELNKALSVLAKLTDGKVYLSLSPKSPSVLKNAKVADIHYFTGKHPAGNVGVQIHHIKPIKSNQKVWTIDLQSVLTLGKLFLEGIYDTERVVALTGAPLEQPKYVRTKVGANIGELLAGNLSEGNNRIIAGDILTGQQVDNDSFLNFTDNQITVLEEGDKYEAFGWLLPLAPRPSISKTFPGFLMPNYEYNANTNTHGEERAFVVTGQYESVTPMDIYPQHLMKAILAGDIERMEGLGINEVLEEDVAIAEFACTSKQPLQQILRGGLDMMREQV